MFHIRWHKLYNYYHGTEYGSSTAKKTVDVLQSLLKVTRENSYNDSGNFKCIYVIGQIFHPNFPTFSPEAWQTNNDLTMDLMKIIIDHTGNEGPVIKNTIILSSKTMIDED